LLSMDRVALLAISTPDDEDNYYSELINFKDKDGKSLFNVIPVGLACEPCKDLGKAADCPHRTDILPRWRSVEGQELQKLLLPEGVYSREAQGLITTTKKFCFPRHLLNRMFAPERNLAFERPVGVMYIAMDPSGGSNRSSALSLVGISYKHNPANQYEPYVVVTAIADTFQNDNTYEANFIHEFLRRIRAHPRYSRCLIVNIIESDLNAPDSKRHGQLFMQYPPAKCLTHVVNGEEQIGIRTGIPYNKLRYARDTRAMIEKGLLVVASDVVLLAKTEEDRTQLLTKFHDQLRIVALIEEPPKRVGFQHVNYTVSGKHTGRPDDMAMALMMAVHFSTGLIQKRGFEQSLEASQRSLVTM